jgi:hypothetical protein
MEWLRNWPTPPVNFMHAFEVAGASLSWTPADTEIRSIVAGAAGVGVMGDSAATQ